MWCIARKVGGDGEGGPCELGKLGGQEVVEDGRAVRVDFGADEVAGEVQAVVGGEGRVCVGGMAR
jgi:hypothetical protein